MSDPEIPDEAVAAHARVISPAFAASVLSDEQAEGIRKLSRRALAAALPALRHQWEMRDMSKTARVEVATALDLRMALEPWLNQCGSCDAGLTMNCTCPKGDIRPLLLMIYNAISPWNPPVAREFGEGT